MEAASLRFDACFFVFSSIEHVMQMCGRVLLFFCLGLVGPVIIIRCPFVIYVCAFSGFSLNRPVLGFCCKSGLINITLDGKKKILLKIID